MAQTLVVRFKESPFSPWGTGSLATRTPGAGVPDGYGSLRCPVQTIGSLSAVNAQIGELGLKRRAFLPPLVAEEPVAERMEKPKQREISDVKEHMDAKLIELANFPGFTSDRLTPLPHGLDTLEHLKMVTRAQPRLAIKASESVRWRKLFYSPYSQGIFQDTFWWFFLHKYQPKEKIQDKLFSRVSVNYVKLLCEDCDHRWREVFFKVYPNVVSQAVYSAFVHAFPASWSSFDDGFKTELCKTVFLWQVGTKPIPTLWQRWDLDALEPPGLLKNVGKEDHQSLTSHKQGFHLDALVRETRREEEEVDASLKFSSQPPSGPIPLQVGKGNLSHPAGEQDSTSSLASIPSATKQAEAQLSRPVSFAELEKALCSQSHQLQQPENVTNARTHGEVTPGLQSTMAQRKKIEVAKQQLAKLKMQKVLEAKAKAARKGSKASSSTGKTPKTNTTSTALSAKRSQSTQPPTSQKAPPVSKPQQQPVPKVQQQQQQPLMKAVVPGSKQGSGTSVPMQSKAPVNVEAPTRPPPTIRTSQVDSAPSVPSTSQTKVANPLVPNHTPHGQLPPRSTVAKTVAAQHQASDKADQPQSSKAVSTEKAKAGVCEEERGGTWKEKALALKKETSMPISGPGFEHVVFDAHGQSPLVKHYLQRRNLNYDSGYSILLQRTELDRLPPTDAPTFEDIIRDSSKEHKKIHTQFKNHYARQKQSMAQSQRQRRKDAAKHEQDAKKVLADKKEVQQLASELAAYRNKKGEKGGDKQAASKAVVKTLQRVTTL